jgi:hypothetical protein
MATGAGAWRTLAPNELAAEPDARVGGALVAMVVAALLAFVPVIFLLANGLADPKGTAWVVLMMARQAFGGDMKSAFIASSFLQMAAILIWAMIFVAATLLRGRWGPSLTGGVFAVCALMGPVNQVAIMAIFAADTFGVYQVGAQLTHWVPNLVAAISFWAYMHEARRPNLYYHRRVRIEPADGVVA